MEIGRLEFYATKRDKRGKYFGKVYAYSGGARHCGNRRLLFFHETCISSNSALREDGSLRDYRYETCHHGKSLYDKPVYVAFDIRHSSKNPDATATNVMLLEEADSATLPEITSIDSDDARTALITAFPKVFSLTSVGLDLLPSTYYDSHSQAFKTCWDKSDDDERRTFMSSLNSETLEQIMAYFIVVDRLESGSYTALRRTRQALAVRPDAALKHDVAAMLGPGLWVDEMLGLMSGGTDVRRAFLTSKSPDFRAFALTRLIKQEEGPLPEDVVDDVVDTARLSNGNLGLGCMRAALERYPGIALRDDIAAMLRPVLWVDGMLGLISYEAEGRHIFLARTPRDFQIHALTKLIEQGEGHLPDDVVDDVLEAVQLSSGGGTGLQCLRAALARDPGIALRHDIAAMLGPDLWVDEMFELMRNPANQRFFFTSCNPDFKIVVANKLVDAGLPLDICVFKNFPLHILPKLMGRVNWSADNEVYAEAIEQWLSEACLSGAEVRELIVSVAMQMHDERTLLSPTMWEHLPTVMKIRLLIYWSNHYADLDDYTVRGGIVKLCVDAYKNSWEGYDPTLKAVMLFFSLPMARDAEKAFCHANDALLGEIVRQFNECDADSLRYFTLSEELQMLLQRCGMYTKQQLVRGFCDGREWKKDNGNSTVWCHRGVDRPRNGRRECTSIRSPINADNLRHAQNANIAYQFMADFLYNVSNAIGERMNVGSVLGDTDMDLVEYAYRISGFVNKMSSVLSHMVCRGCGARLGLRYQYPRRQLYYTDSLEDYRLELPSLSATVCSCPRADNGDVGHDVSVYINYCLNCHRVIDSRECAMKDQEGYYLCMYCGASKQYKAVTICPKCGNTNPSLLCYCIGSMSRERSYFERNQSLRSALVVCNAPSCNYDARDFRSSFD